MCEFSMSSMYKTSIASQVSIMCSKLIVCCFSQLILLTNVCPAYSMLRGPRYPPSTVVLSPTPAHPGQPQFIQSPPWSSTPVYANGSPQKNMLWSVDRSPYNSLTQRSTHNVTHWHRRRWCDICRLKSYICDVLKV